jgi:hypothetical protein
MRINARYIWRRIFRPGHYRYTALFQRIEAVERVSIRGTMDTREWLGGELDRIHDSITRANANINALTMPPIELTEELANMILDRMRGPLTISQGASDWLRTLVSSSPMQWTSPLGWNQNAGQIRQTITPEGTLNIELVTGNGESVWRGEFTPPDYRKAL